MHVNILIPPFLMYLIAISLSLSISAMEIGLGLVLLFLIIYFFFNLLFSVSCNATHSSNLSVIIDARVIL